MIVGAYWNIHSEFDILAVTKDKKLFWESASIKTVKSVKMNSLNLKPKHLKSGIKVDVYALFSKSGFSNELLQTQDEDLLLFDLNDLKALMS